MKMTWVCCGTVQWYGTPRYTVVSCRVDDIMTCH